MSGKVDIGVCRRQVTTVKKPWYWTLTLEDLEHYCIVVTALKETIRLMSEIDAAIPNRPIE